MSFVLFMGIQSSEWRGLLLRSIELPEYYTALAVHGLRLVLDNATDFLHGFLTRASVPVSVLSSSKVFFRSYLEIIS
jgi:hypothetical protein